MHKFWSNFLFSDSFGFELDFEFLTIISRIISVKYFALMICSFTVKKRTLELNIYSLDFLTLCCTKFL